MIVICAKAHLCNVVANKWKCDHNLPHEKQFYGCNPTSTCEHLNEKIPCVELETDKRYDVQWE
jgi:hypothetical protein